MIGFFIEQGIAEASKNFTSLDSQLIRSTKAFHKSNETEVTVDYLPCSKYKVFCLISLMKQTLFLATLIDIGTKQFLDRSGRQR